MRLSIPILILISLGVFAVAGEKKPVVPNPPSPSPATAKADATAPLMPITADTAANSIFGGKKAGSEEAPRPIGTYNRGCLAGGEMLPIDGPAWQAMRLSRNRNWGHPKLIAYLKRLAIAAQDEDGWPGLLVGDLAQPMGGPMVSGHASHQIGLDADIWLNPMPKKTLSNAERENISAKSMLAADKVSVDDKIWTPEHGKLIKRAASYPEVARIFVHPAIKKKLCDTADEKERDWLSKIRPWWGHHYHFHVRLACPKDAKLCAGQPAVGSDDGCGKELTRWLGKIKPPKKPVAPPSKTPVVTKRSITFAQLPEQCADVAGVEIKTEQAGVPLPVHRPASILPDGVPPKPEKAEKADGKTKS